MIDDINEVWATMNKLYWYKDSLDTEEDQRDYLQTLRQLAKQLDMSGLEKEINDYLEILK